MKAMVIDINKCNGCFNCQIACKDEHVDNDWTPYAKPQPDTGHFWKKVEELVRGSVPKVKVTHMHTICRHCDNPHCIPACPEQAIFKRDDGIVIVDPEKCKGEKACMDACPYGVIFFNEELNIAQKCTFCAHLIDKGWKVPRCVDVCPTGALTFGEEEDLKDLIDGVEILNPEYNSMPRVYYMGLPKKFVAGAVYDPEEDECIEGATVILTDTETGETYTTTTDTYGDFWINKLKEGIFSLSIEKRDYQTHEIESIHTEKDINVGDIPLKRID